MKVRIQLEDIESPEGPGVDLKFEFDPPPSQEIRELMEKSLAVRMGTAAGNVIAAMMDVVAMASPKPVQDLTPPT